MKNRILSILLALCMVLAFVPATAFAADTAETVTPTTVAKDITLGTSAIQDPSEVTTGSRKYYTPNSYIYFGKNGTTPIKWRVLDADKANDGTTAGMFLLSEYVLATGVQFNASTSSGNNYQGSNAQNWCKDFVESSSNFSDTDQKAMLGVAKTDSTEEVYNLSWSESSLTIADKAFFLSARELADYVGNYNDAPGLVAKNAAQASFWWWLRSPDAGNADRAGVVDYDGVVLYSTVDDHHGVRPALNLNLSSVLFTSAAVGGKSSNAAAGGGAGIFENVDISTLTDSDGYKLTLLDSNRNAFTATLNSISDKTVTVSYSGAKTSDNGDNEYISAIIKNGDVIKYYGRLGLASESGTATVTLPDDFNAANGDVLCIFNEQYNGDYKTDYASNLIDVMPFDYTVNFNANGGEGTMPSQTMTYGVAANLSANTFTRSGYTFNGWNTDADGNGTAYSEGQSVTNLVSDASTPSVTLYAQWEEEIITLTVPFTTTVALGDVGKPGETVFDLAIVQAGVPEESYARVTVSGTLTTNGEGSYDGILTLTGPSEELQAMLCEGAIVQQVNGGEANWTYDDTVWGLLLYNGAMYADLNDDQEQAPAMQISIYPATCENTDDGPYYKLDWEAVYACQTVDEMTFTNTYTAHEYALNHDTAGHWDECPCGDVQNQEAHKFGEWKVTKDATASAKGEKERVCSVCDYVETAEIPMPEENEPPKTDVPQTGDDRNMALWFTLLFVSGGALIGTAVYDKKRKYSAK